MGKGTGAGDVMKVAIPLAATAAAIWFTGGAAAPAILAGEGAAGAGAAGGGAGLSFLGGAGAGEAAGLGGEFLGSEALGASAGGAGWGTAGLGGAASGGGVGAINPSGLTPISGGWVPPTMDATSAPFNWQQGANNGFMGMMGGKMISDVAGLNQPPRPFQMGSAQAPSPIGGGGGRFQPTSDSSMAMLANRMAQRQQQRESRSAGFASPNR